MLLKRVDSIFGINMEIVKKERKRMLIGVLVGLVVDIFVVVMAVWNIMSNSNVSGVESGVSAYLLCCFVGAIFFNVVVSGMTKNSSDCMEAYTFYKKHKYDNTCIKKYKVTEDILFSVLFCAGYQRVKPDCSFDTYIENLRSACCQSYKYSRKIMKHLSKYEDEEGNLSVCIVDRKKQYFVDVKEV